MSQPPSSNLGKRTLTEAGNSVEDRVLTMARRTSAPYDLSGSQYGDIIARANASASRPAVPPRVQTPAPVQRIMIWDTRTQRKLPQSECPASTDLEMFLDENPHLEVYAGQQPRPVDLVPRSSPPSFVKPTPTECLERPQSPVAESTITTVEATTPEKPTAVTQEAVVAALMPYLVKVHVNIRFDDMEMALQSPTLSIPLL